LRLEQERKIGTKIIKKNRDSTNKEEVRSEKQRKIGMQKQRRIEIRETKKNRNEKNRERLRLKKQRRIGIRQIKKD
jgi:hypothetical protein